MKKDEMKVDGKTVAKVSGKTILILFIFLAILFLDVLVIRGVYLGIQYVGECIQELSERVSDWWGSEEKEETETERSLTREEIREIWEKEEEELRRIQEKNSSPKPIPED